MRFISFVLLLSTMFLFPNDSKGYGAAHAVCENGQHVVTASGGIHVDLVGEIVGIVFQREPLGLCEEIITVPDNPVPLVLGDECCQWVDFEASASFSSPHDQVVYRYTPFLVKSDGTLLSMTANCGADMRSYALVSCEETPLIRGELVVLGGGSGPDDFMLGIATCEEECWGEGTIYLMNATEFEEISGQPWVLYWGQVIDVYGTRTYCTMLGGPYFDFSQIELTEGGECVPVAVESKSWGGLKALYR